MQIKQVRFTSIVIAVLVGAGCYASETHDCPSGFVVCDGYCIQPQSTHRHCGACGRACADDQACVDGACVPFCAYAEVSDVETLVSYLRNEGWDTVPGAHVFVRCVTDLDVEASVVAPNALFHGDIPGLTLSSSPVEVSFRDDGRCHTYTDPITAYSYARFQAGAVFGLTTETYLGRPYAALPPPGDTVCGGHSGYCWVDVDEHQPILGECCCRDEPYDWRLLGLSPELATCGAPAVCDAPLVGPHPSECFESYADYVAQFPDVAPSCVDGSGFVMSGRPCLCDLIEPGEPALSVDGRCDDGARCVVDRDCSIPSICLDGPGCVLR